MISKEVRPLEAQFQTLVHLGDFKFIPSQLTCGRIQAMTTQQVVEPSIFCFSFMPYLFITDQKGISISRRRF